MKRRTHVPAAVLASLILATLAVADPAGAQERTSATEGFQLGYMDVGPTLGLGGIGSASLAFGARVERAIKAVPDLGNGIIGVQLSADYYSWSGAGYSWSYIPIGATGNYHFKLENAKIDPFLGLGLGYSIISCDYPGTGTDLCSNSTLYFIGRAGARYFVTPKIAVYGDVGAGAATLNVGGMFRVN